MALTAALCIGSASAQDAAPEIEELPVAPPTAASNEPALKPDDPRISLSLQPTPLHVALNYLAMGQGLKFGYGGVPDAVVKADFEDAPLLPALRTLLNGTGFEMRAAPDGDGRVWLFRNLDTRLPVTPTGVYSVSWTPQSTPVQTTEQTSGAAWEIWTRTFAPPPGWNIPPAPKGTVQVSMGSFAQSTAGWETANLQIGAAEGTTESKPASDMVEVFLPPEWKPEASELYLRWPMQLRTVPRNTQLVLNLPYPATLTVNGAPIFRGKQGAHRLDVTRLMRLGPNSLSLHFEELPENWSGPLLSYAWLLPGSGR